MKKTLVSVSDDLKDFCPLTLLPNGRIWARIELHSKTGTAKFRRGFPFRSRLNSFARRRSASWAKMATVGPWRSKR